MSKLHQHKDCRDSYYIVSGGEGSGSGKRGGYGTWQVSPQGISTIFRSWAAATMTRTSPDAVLRDGPLEDVRHHQRRLPETAG